MWTTRLALLLALFVAGACTPPDVGDGAADSPIADTSAAAPPANRFQATHRLAERIRIGPVEGPSEQALGDVRALEIDRLGRVYIADALQQRVLVFHRSGDLVRSLGREGQGPGELLWPSGMTWQDDSTVWILDLANQRYSVYDTAGRHLKDARRPPLGTLSPWRARFEGGQLIEVRIGSDGYNLVLLDPNRTDGPIRDTLRYPLADVPLSQWHPVYHERSESTVRRRRIPFTEGWEWVLDGQGGAWIGDTGDYRLVHLSLDGESLGEFSHRIVGAPISRDEQTAAEDSLAGAGYDPSALPDRKPVFRSVQVTRAGNVALIREGVGSAWILDVLTPSGELLRSADLPTTPDLSVFPVIDDWEVWLLSEGELGEPVVVGLGWEELARR